MSRSFLCTEFVGFICPEFVWNFLCTEFVGFICPGFAWYFLCPEYVEVICPGIVRNFSCTKKTRQILDMQKIPDNKIDQISRHFRDNF